MLAVCICSRRSTSGGVHLGDDVNALLDDTLAIFQSVNALVDLAQPVFEIVQRVLHRLDLHFYRQPQPQPR